MKLKYLNLLFEYSIPFYVICNLLIKEKNNVDDNNKNILNEFLFKLIIEEKNFQENKLK